MGAGEEGEEARGGFLDPGIVEQEPSPELLWRGDVVDRYRDRGCGGVDEWAGTGGHGVGGVGVVGEDGRGGGVWC